MLRGLGAAAIAGAVAWFNYDTAREYGRECLQQLQVILQHAADETAPHATARSTICSERMALTVLPAMLAVLARSSSFNAALEAVQQAQGAEEGAAEAAWHELVAVAAAQVAAVIHTVAGVTAVLQLLEPACQIATRLARESRAAMAAQPVPPSPGPAAAPERTQALLEQLLRSLLRHWAAEVIPGLVAQCEAQARAAAHAAGWSLTGPAPSLVGLLGTQRLVYQAAGVCESAPAPGAPELAVDVAVAQRQLQAWAGVDRLYLGTDGAAEFDPGTRAVQVLWDAADAPHSGRAFGAQLAGSLAAGCRAAAVPLLQPDLPHRQVSELGSAAAAVPGIDPGIHNALRVRAPATILLLQLQRGVCASTGDGSALSIPVRSTLSLALKHPGFAEFVAGIQAHADRSG